MRKSPFRGTDLSVPICFLLLLTSYFIPGWFFQLNDDFALEQLFREHTVDQDFGPYMRILGPLISQLYQLWPSVPLYGIVLVSLQLLASLIIIYHLSRTIQLAGFYKHITLLFFVSFFFIEHFFFLTFSKTGFLLAIASLILLRLSLQRLIQKTLRPPGIAADSLLFIASLILILLAILIRKEMALLAVGIWIVHELVSRPYSYWRNNSSFLTIYPSIPAILILVSSVLPGQLSETERSRFSLAANIQDYSYEKAAWMENRRDSLIRICATRFFSSDTAVFTEAQLQKMTCHRIWDCMSQRNPIKNPGLWNSERQKLYTQIKRSHPTFLLTLGITCLLLFISFSNFLASSLCPELLKLSLLGLLILFSLYLFEVYLKCPDRIVGPMITVWMMWMLSSSLFKDKKLATGLIFLTCIFSGKQQFSYYQEELRASKTAQIKSTSTWKEIESASPASTILTTIPIYYHLASDQNPFHSYLRERHLIQLDGWTARTPEFSSYLVQRTGQRSFDLQLHNLLIEDHVPVLGNSRSMEILSLYLKTFYNSSLEFELIQESKDWEVKLYRAVQ